jgi:hypothetical protein
MKAFWVMASVLLSGSMMRADLIPALAGSPALITTGAFAGDYAWTYSVSLAGDQQVVPAAGLAAGATQPWPNFFTIFDFGSPSATAMSMPSDWTGSAAVPDATHAFLQNAPNQASISDIQISYTGSTTITGPQTICCFTFIATTNQVALGWYEGQGTKFDPNSLADATQQGNVGRIAVPYSASGNLQQIPEPATFILLGSSLLGLGILRRRKA